VNLRVKVVDWTAMAGGTEIALSRIGQIAVRVKDVARATEFYRDKLGMKHLFSASNLAFFDCGGIRLMLDKPEKTESGTSILYFSVADIHQAYAQLTSRAIEFVDHPHLIAKLTDHDLWMTFFRDSEGNLLGIMSEVRTKAVSGPAAS
jgi:methylmalonyl-CoA/ethylmalonyl-CoA epimerase